MTLKISWKKVFNRVEPKNKRTNSRMYRQSLAKITLGNFTLLTFLCKIASHFIVSSIIRGKNSTLLMLRSLLQCQEKLGYQNQKETAMLNVNTLLLRRAAKQSDMK